VPKTYEERLCQIYPFGEKGAELICISNERCCTVTLVTYGYIGLCDKENFSPEVRQYFYEESG